MATLSQSQFTTPIHPHNNTSHMQTQTAPSTSLHPSSFTATYAQAAAHHKNQFNMVPSSAADLNTSNNHKTQHETSSPTPSPSTYNELVNTYNQLSQPSNHTNNNHPHGYNSYHPSLQPTTLYHSHNQHHHTAATPPSSSSLLSNHPTNTMQYNNTNNSNSHNELILSPNNPTTSTTSKSSTSSSPLLYHHTIPVHIRYSNQSRESYIEQLTVKLSYINAPAAASHLPYSAHTHHHTHSHSTTNNMSNNNNLLTRCLHVEITNENNTYMLYSTTINELQFSSLKREQQLLVDFQQLPMSIAQMLNVCVSTDKNHEQHCVLEIQETSQNHPQETHQMNPAFTFAYFKIVKNIDFRHVDFLCLTLQHGNNDEIKEYLSKKLHEYKQQYYDVNERYEKQTIELQGSKNDTQRLSSMIESYKLTSNEQIHEITVKHHHDLQALKEKHRDEMKQQYDTYQQQQQKEEQEYKHTIQVLNSSMSEMTKKFQDLQESKHQLETRLTLLQNQYDTSNTQLSAANKELIELRTKHINVDTQLYDTTTIQQKQQLRLAALEQSVIEKENLIQQLQSSAEQYIQSKQQVDETLRIYKEQAHVNGEKLEHACNEIHKGNDYIEKLQQKIKSLKQKLQLKSNVISEQETVIHEKQNELKDKIYEIESMNKEMTHKNSEIKKLEELSEKSQGSLAEMQNQLEKDKQIIDYLNTELNNSKIPSSTAHFRTYSSPLNPLVNGVSSMNLNLNKSTFSTLNSTNHMTTASSSSTSVGAVGVGVGKSVSTDTSPATNHLHASQSLFSLKSPPAAHNVTPNTQHMNGGIPPSHSARNTYTGTGLQSAALFTPLPATSTPMPNVITIPPSLSKQSSYFNNNGNNKNSIHSNRNSLNNQQNHSVQHTNVSG